eukprot:CAMPEP_0174260976 /NCGR_PEP_ID=MMETSP0439-20130205/11136_1 /TAXON_ID=0 /ORGANISM="Stereomyxa ramosa, Strain Chinc5" /LENGTH=327 /DNA_ID=CAMNT_0015345369 /DNA_START=352 /DNA_END=1337 /DNA_ORIENTATION=-
MVHKECPNLEKEETYREDIELEELGGWKNCSFEYQSSILSYCAHLCFSHPSYGVAAVPLSLWKRAQIAESNYWKNDHSGSDRGFEHVGAFLSYKCLPLYLGKVVEIGSGPWGQFREILRANPNVEVTSYTPWDPNAHEYLNNPSCSYRDGLHLIPLKNTPDGPNYQSGEEYFKFPVVMRGKRGEDIKDKYHEYDTLVVINVVEHVLNAFEFYNGLFHAIKPGGILIFHDRFFPDPVSANCVLGTNTLHPIRLKREVIDHFLSGFDILFTIVITTPDEGAEKRVTISLLEKRNSATFTSTIKLFVPFTTTVTKSLTTTTKSIVSKNLT